MTEMRLTMPPWRAYPQVIADNGKDAGAASMLLAAWPVFLRGPHPDPDGPKSSILDFSADTGFNLLDACDALADLEDQGLLVWDQEQQTARLNYVRPV